MVKSARFCVLSFNGTGSANTSYTSGLGMAVDDFATESGVYVNSREAGTYSNMQFVVFFNTMGDTTLTLRHNGANGNLTLSIPLFSTGTYEDTTHTDTFTDGQTFSYRIDRPATTGTIQGFLRTHFEPTDSSKTLTHLGYAYDDWPVGTSAANTTYYFPLTGTAHHNNTTESYVRTTFKEALTIRNFQVCISENARSSTATTYQVRKNGSNGNSVISVSAGSTGLHEDTTHTDSIAIDDYVNLSLTTGNETGKIAATHQSVYLQTSSGTPIIPLHCGSAQSASGGEPFTYSSGDFYIFFGDLWNGWSSSEPGGGINLGLAGTVKRLFVRSGANTCNGSTTVNLRQNLGNTDLTLSIGASATGDFWDTTHTTSVATTDEMCYHVNASGSSGTIYLGVINSSLELSGPPSEPAGVVAKVVSVLSNSGTGTQDITFTADPAWTPKVALVSWSRANTSADAFQEHMSSGFGFTDGTNSRCVAIASEDNAARGDSAKIQRNDALICTLNPTGTIETVDSIATFTQWLSNGMQITWSDAPGAQFYLTVLFLGGSAITDATVGTLMTGTGTSPISVSSLSYQPDVGMFLSGGQATENSATVSGFMSIGAATSSSAQWVQTVYSVDNPVTMSTRQYYSHGKVVVSNTTSVDGYATFTTFDTNGFTLTPTDAFPSSFPLYYLVIKGGDFAVGNNTEPASTQQQTTTTNKDTKAVMIFGIDTGSADAVQTGCMQTIGMGTASGNQGCNVFEDTHNVADSIVVSRYDTNQIYLNITSNATATSSTLDDEAALYSLSSTGFTLDWTNIGQARPFRYITFGGISTTPISQTKTHKWNTIAKITNSKTHKYNIVSKVTNSKTHKFHILVAVSTSKTHKFNIFKIVALTKTHKWNSISKVLPTKTHKYNIIIRVSPTRTHKFNLLNSIPTVSKTHKYTIVGYVSKSKIHKYNVEQAVIQVSTTKTHKWNVISKAVATKTHKYSLLNSISLTKTHKYNLISVVSTTKTHKYSLLNTVSTSKTHKYSLLNSVSTTKTHKWNIISRATTTKTHKYSLAGKVTASRTHKYGIAGVVTRTHTHKYNILQRVALIEKIHRYNISNITVTASKTHKYNVIKIVLTTKTHKYNVVSEAVSTTKTHKYNIISKITQSKTHKYNLISVVTTSKTHKFNVIGKVTQSKTHLYNIIQRISVTKTHIYSINLAIFPVQTSKTHKFSLIARISASKTHIYTIISKITASKTHKYGIIIQLVPPLPTKTHKYNILVSVSTITKTHKYNISIAVSKSKTHKWNLLTAATTTKTHKYNLAGKITRSRTHKFNIIKSVSKTHTHKYNISIAIVGAPANKTHIYSILSKVTKTKTHKYNIIGRITKTKTHRWNSGGKVTTTKTHIYDLGQFFELPIGAGSSTVVHIKVPERIRIVDIIADIRNLAIANIELRSLHNEPRIICVGLVELEEFPIIKTASTSYKPRHRIASTLICPQVIDTIDNRAISSRIGIEALEPSAESRIQVLSHMQIALSYPNCHTASGHTQIKQRQEDIIRLSSSTQLSHKTHVASMANLELVYLNNIQFKTIEIMTRERERTIRSIIDVLKSDAFS